MGRGLVEPVDDMRATNPATNIPLMNALAEHLAATGFNTKQFVRTIMSSRLYQLDSQPTSQNLSDDRFYSHFPVKRLGAEALLDAMDYAAGTQTKFKELPLGTRAIDIPDAEYPDYFLNTFAKPRRASVCECERSPDPNLAQALHTLNGDILATKIAQPTGRIGASRVQRLTSHGDRDRNTVRDDEPMPTPQKPKKLPKLAVEQRVNHEKFGDGVITALAGEGTASAIF